MTLYWPSIVAGRDARPCRNHANSIMSDSTAASSLQRNKELEALYEGSADGILIAEIRSMRLVRANRAICRMLGYSEQELLSLSIKDIHPPDALPAALGTYTSEAGVHHEG